MDRQPSEPGIVLTEAQKRQRRSRSVAIALAGHAGFAWVLLFGRRGPAWTDPDATTLDDAGSLALIHQLYAALSESPRAARLLAAMGCGRGPVTDPSLSEITHSVRATFGAFANAAGRISLLACGFSRSASG